MKSSVASLSEQVSTLKEDLAKQDVLDKVQDCCIVCNNACIVLRYFNTLLSIIRNSVSIAIMFMHAISSVHHLCFNYRQIFPT